MKTQHWLIALLVFFTCSTVVYADQSVHNTNHKLDNLTQNDGLTALKIGDALGFEVIERKELEGVRGESVLTTAFGAVINYISGKFGSDTRFTLFSPLTACAPTKDNPSC